jgi:hypothetical protein
MKWLRYIRGAVGMGLTWAVVWAPIAVLVGLLVDPDGSMDEMWVAIGAYPGFLGGVVFSAILAIAARRRTLGDLSLSRVAAWGAVAGLLVGVLPFTIREPTTERPLWLLALVVVGSLTVLSGASAAGSLALARMAEKRRPLRAAALASPSGTSNRPAHNRIDWQGGESVDAVRATGAKWVGPCSRVRPERGAVDRFASGLDARP